MTASPDRDAAKPPRTFTPARVPALALIGLAVLALAWIRFAPDSGPVSVPAGAQAGDLVLESCRLTPQLSGRSAEFCGPSR